MQNNLSQCEYADNDESFNVNSGQKKKICFMCQQQFEKRLPCCFQGNCINCQTRPDAKDQSVIICITCHSKYNKYNLTKKKENGGKKLLFFKK